MVDITFISHGTGDGLYYQVQVRTTNEIFGEESNIRPLCFGTNDLLELINSTLPILEHSAANDTLGITLIGSFPHMAYTAIHNQAERIAENCGSKVYFHEHGLDIL